CSTDIDQRSLPCTGRATGRRRARRRAQTGKVRSSLGYPRGLVSKYRGDSKGTQKPPVRDTPGVRQNGARERSPNSLSSPAAATVQREKPAPGDRKIRCKAPSAFPISSGCIY